MYMTLQETHNLTQLEELLADYFSRLGTAITKGEQKEIRKKLKLLEAHWRSITDKHENGKKYPVKVVPKDISKKELLELIESGFPEEKWKGRTVTLTDEFQDLDLSGVSVGKNRFEFVDKGW